MATELEKMPEHPPITEIYKRYISPNEHTNVAGPGPINWDGTLFWLSNYYKTSNGTGKLTFDDPQYLASVPKKNEQVVGYVAGVNSGNYRDNLAVLKSYGLDIHLPTWNGPNSGLHHIDIKDGTVQTIVDHDTSLFASWAVLGEYLPPVSKKNTAIKKASDYLRKCILEEYRVLKHSGHLLLSVNKQHYFFEDKQELKPLIEIIKASGFSKVERLTVNDHVEISIRLETSTNISSNKQLTHLAKFCGERYGSYTIKIPSVYSSPDLLVCTK